MNPNKSTPKSRLTQSRGWDHCTEARYICATDAWTNTPEFKSHGHTMRRLFEDIGVEAIVCTEGRPTVCVKDGRHLNAEEIEELRKKLWNLGATTLLLVEQPTKVLVFSTITKPSEEDRQGISAALGSETIDSLEKAELALRLQQFVRRVETGAIYRDHKSLFNPKQAVDQLLLKNLRATRDLLCKEKTVEGYRRAHALIGKFLFSCYLLDRGIIGPAYLRKKGLPEASNSLDLLTNVFGYQGRILESLFNSLQNDFNGSLFGDQLEIEISDIEADYLCRFLSGENLRTGQQTLFRLYDFSFIPVELISSIYQEFLNAESEVAAQPSRKNQNRSHGQRTQGAYYTPPRLAELTVDIATKGWDTLLDKRCIDPACGSGIFLVILFVRMAEEWRKRNPNASTEQRYKELMRLLTENLLGIDINLTACLVTCFSLYLAFLDQMEPKEIMELHEALERSAREKLLPRILWERDKHRPRTPHLGTIRELDFFDLQPEPEFDLVVGNPPWVSRKDTLTVKSAEAWLFDEKQNPIAKEMNKSERRQRLFPASEVACAFMWKAGLHVRSGGDVCQVLPSRVFLSNNTDKFQSTWLKHHRLKSVWLLADYSFILFPGADCPSFIGWYHPRQDNETAGEFEFITPKVELLDPRESLIPVQPEDQKILNEADIITAAERNEAALAWKQHYWGTTRDTRLIDRLMRMPRLKQLVTGPPDAEATELPEVESKRKWWKGQGFKPFNEASYQRSPERYGEPKKRWWEDSHLYLPANSSVGGLVLLKQECEVVGKRFSKLHRAPNKALFKSPFLLINQAYTKFLFSDFDVLFQHDFQAICAPKSEEEYLLFLTAVISSPLAQYLLFHTTANIGIERDKAHLEEVLELPFPLPEDMADLKRSQAILFECANLLRNLKRELSNEKNLLRHDSLLEETQQKLNAFVYDYFGICDWERYLIEDTVEIFRPSSTPGSFDSKKLITAKPSQKQDRELYADTLIATFRGWTRSKESLWAEGHLATKSGLAMVTFGVGGKARAYEESQVEERVEEVLAKIGKSSARSKDTLFRCLRGFAFYEDEKVHLLKPLSRRHWTRTAALNDADEILAHMMKEDGWGA